MRQIEITKADVFELDPSKKYLLVMPRGQLTRADAATLTRELKKMGVEALGILIEDPGSVKVIESTKRKEGVA